MFCKLLKICFFVGRVFWRKCSQVNGLLVNLKLKKKCQVGYLGLPELYLSVLHCYYSVVILLQRLLP